MVKALIFLTFLGSTKQSFFSCVFVTKTYVTSEFSELLGAQYIFENQKSFNKKNLKSVGMTLAKVKEQDGMTLAKVKEQDGMTVAK